MQVTIHKDELWLTVVHPHVPNDDEPPSYFLPVEVPDELVAEADAAWRAWRDVTARIVEMYGTSDTDPDYKATSDAWWKERHPTVAANEKQGIEKAWAEYHEQYPEVTTDHEEHG